MLQQQKDLYSVTERTGEEEYSSQFGGKTVSFGKAQ